MGRDKYRLSLFLQLKQQRTNDAAGFDVEAVRFASDQGRGLGLLGMQERVAALGGNLEIDLRSSSGAMARGERCDSANDQDSAHRSSEVGRRTACRGAERRRHRMRCRRPALKLR